jgi:hypothetical protein
MLNVLHNNFSLEDFQSIPNNTHWKVGFFTFLVFVVVETIALWLLVGEQSILKSPVLRSQLIKTQQLSFTLLCYS